MTPRCDCPAMSVPHTHEQHGPEPIPGALPIATAAPASSGLRMRLTDLSPRWVAAFGEPVDAKQGISFACPCCRSLRLAIFFDVPVCGRPPVDLKALHRSQSETEHLSDHHVGRVLWHREGNDFDSLTLTPSVDASRFGHWHGHVTAGAIE